MVAGMLFLMLVLLAALLAASIYKIATTSLAAVDAPTLAMATASAAAAARPSRARTGGTLPPRAARGPHTWSSAALLMAGLAAVTGGGWLLLRTAHADACPHHAIEICSQGYVLLTGAQLAGGGLALAGLGSVIAAIALAPR